MVRPKGFPGLPEGWTSEWETFPSSDGKVQLFSVTHRPKTGWQGKRALLIVHGFGEHGGRYLHVPHFLNCQGSPQGGPNSENAVVDSVTCLDLRGHGRSEGLRGHVEKFDLLCDDVAASVRRLENSLRTRFGRAEVHLLGHSLGGHVSLRTLFLHPGLPLASAQVVAPYLGLKLKVPAVKKAAAHVLAKVWGTLQLGVGVDAAVLSHDAAVVEAYRTDRLVHGKMTPMMFESMSAAIADTLSRDSGIQPPIQYLVPLADSLVDSEKALEHFRALKHRSKKLKTYPGFFHEVLNETEKAQAFADVATWILANSAGGSS